MSTDELTRILIKGAVAEMPEDQRARVNECTEKVRTVIAEYGPFGQLAIAIIGSEMAAKEE